MVPATNLVGLQDTCIVSWHGVLLPCIDPTDGQALWTRGWLLPRSLTAARVPRASAGFEMRKDATSSRHPLIQSISAFAVTTTERAKQVASATDRRKQQCSSAEVGRDIKLGTGEPLHRFLGEVFP
jgi:hypothetical protein